MNTTMEKLSMCTMCRICLSKGTPLHSTVNTRLHEIYEVLTKMPFVTEDCSPIQVCELCCASLEHSYELRMKCLQSEKLLAQLLRSNVQVNLQIMFNKYLDLGDVVQMTPIQCDNVEVKQEYAEDERDNNSASPDSVDDTATFSFLKEEIETDNEMPDERDNNSASPDSVDDTATFSFLKEEIETDNEMPDSVEVTATLKEEIETDNEMPDERDDNSSSPDSVEVTATLKEEIETDNEMPGSEEDPLKGNDHFQSSDSGAITLAIVKKDLSDVTAGAPVCEKPRLTIQMHYEDTPANNLTGSDQTKDNIEELKSETKRAVEDKPVEKNKIVETRDKIDNRLRNNKQNDSTFDYNDTHKELSENKISADQSVNSSSSNKLKQLLCDTCQKCFRYNSELIRHKRTHTGEKPYQCNVCKKCFSEKGHLITHIRTHTGEKPYQCNMCKKCFSVKGHLITHIRTHTGEKPYQCNVCKKCFRVKGSFETHIRTDTCEKPYQCNVCKKCFIQNSDLIKHTCTHTGEKPYQCNVCKKCFIQNSNLIKHIRTHFGEKPYLCKKSFS